MTDESVKIENPATFEHMKKTGALLIKMHNKLEELDDALTGDLEQGVAWMNDERSAKFAKDHPFLCKAWSGAPTHDNPDYRDSVHDLLSEYEELTETHPILGTTASGM